jgi:hypothetical protein
MVKKAAAEVQVESAFIKLLKDPNRFQKLEDGWVRDKLVGIEWGPSSKDEMNFAKAQQYCSKLGGRLPEVNELQSLVDHTKYNPSIDTNIFQDTLASWYWTGTQHAKYADCAWCVGFDYGGVGNGSKGLDNYVRPVRASQ